MAADSATLSDLDTEVHVWLARPDDIHDTKQLETYLRLLSEAERKRRERFHFDVHRKLYLVSHALVRKSASRWTILVPAIHRSTTCDTFRFGDSRSIVPSFPI